MRQRRCTYIISASILALLLLAGACGSAGPATAPPTQPPDTMVPPTQSPPATDPPTLPPPTLPPPTLPPPTLPPPTLPPPTLPPPTLPPPTLPPPTAEPPPATVPYYDNQDSPATLLASYVNAINRGEYERAWDYWDNPPNPSFDDFCTGFAGTALVQLAIHPPTWFDGAAGSRYAPVPTLLLATHTDASQHNFVGCYVARASNVEGAAPGWWLFDATVNPAPGGSDDAALLINACSQPPPFPSEPVYDDTTGPVELLASYANAINLKDYARAWSYWENAPNPSFEEFRDGFAATASVFLVVRPPNGYEGAAGSAFARLPTILLVTNTDTSQHNFAGCYIARSPNLGPGTGVWSLFDASIQALPPGPAGASLLAGACSGF